jgi:hypothetical protein
MRLSIWTWDVLFEYGSDNGFAFLVLSPNPCNAFGFCNVIGCHRDRRILAFAPETHMYVYGSGRCAHVLSSLCELRELLALVFSHGVREATRFSRASTTSPFFLWPIPSGVVSSVE